uniref:ShKT domain-containing protein n=1 Tax=Pseudictyota dubia TaxID=2749911 RepID=A0A7R9VZX7_9STRA
MKVYAHALSFLVLFSTILVAEGEVDKKIRGHEERGAKPNKLFPQELEGKDSRELYYYPETCQNSYCYNPCNKYYGGYGGRKLESEVPEDTKKDDNARELYYYGDNYHPHCYFYGYYGKRRLEEVEGQEEIEGFEGNDHPRQLQGGMPEEVGKPEAMPEAMPEAEGMDPASIEDLEGYYSYKYNQKFIQCLPNGGCVVKPCPAWLWWDDCASVCNYPGAVLYKIYYGKINYYGECVHSYYD